MRSNSKIEVHGGIVGVVILASICLGMTLGSLWLHVAAVVGVLMVTSTFTGAIYFILDKVMPKPDADNNKPYFPAHS